MSLILWLKITSSCISLCLQVSLMIFVWLARSVIHIMSAVAVYICLRELSAGHVVYLKSSSTASNQKVIGSTPVASTRIFLFPSLPVSLTEKHNLSLGSRLIKTQLN